MSGDARADVGSAAPLGAGARWRARLAAVLPGIVGIGLFTLVWQLVALHNRRVIPTIAAIWSELVTYRGPFALNALTTLKEAAVSLAVSFVVAFVLAVAMVEIVVVERAVMPLAVILNVTPVVAFAPGLAIAFNLSDVPRYIVTGVIVFFPLLINSLIGLRSVDPEALDVFTSLAATRREVLVHLRLPSSLPFLFAAARICFPLAIVGAVVAEFVTTGGTVGLGNDITAGVQFTNLAETYAAIVWLAGLGLILTLIVVVAERYLLSWHPSGSLARRAAD